MTKTPYKAIALGLLGVGACASHRTPSALHRTPAAPEAATRVTSEQSETANKIARKREAPEMAKRIFELDGVSGEAEGSGDIVIGPSEDEQEATAITIPIGSKVPIECVIFHDEADPATALRATIQSATKDLNVQTIRTAEVVRLGEHAAVFLEIEHTEKSKPSPVVDLKAMYFEHPITPMLCTHDDPGYRETFRRITKAMAESLKLVDQEAANGKLVALYVDKVDDHPVGFWRQEVFAGKNGTTVSRVQSSTFIPQSPGVAEMRDLAQTEVWDAKGRLLETTFLEIRDGNVELDVEMRKAGPRSYQYEGKSLGKPIGGTFKTQGKAGLVSTQQLTKTITSQLLSGKSTEATLEEYRPLIEPGAPVVVSYKPDAAGPGRLKVSVGSTEIAEVADENGLAERMELPERAAKVTRERIFIRGSL